MLGGHLPELLVVLGLALVIFGPKRIPEISSSLGRGIRDFRKGLSDLETHGVVQDQSKVPVAVPVPIHPPSDPESS
jgi:TatA/E family protein of Tat protein translocase